MRRPEEALHRACVAYLRANLPEPWLCWHSANGGGRSKAEAGIFKALGVLAGMPDLFLLGPGPNLLAIEFKAPPRRLRSGRLSDAKPRLNPAQRSIQAVLGLCGVPYLIVDDMAEMIRTLQSLGVPLKGRAM